MLSIQARVCETELSASADIVSDITVLMELQVGRSDFLNTTSLLITWYHLHGFNVCRNEGEDYPSYRVVCPFQVSSAIFIYIDWN